MFCRNCGSEVNDNIDFCTNCGAKIRKKPTSAPITQSSQEFQEGQTSSSFKVILAVVLVFLVIVLLGLIAFFVVRSRSQATSADVLSEERDRDSVLGEEDSDSVNVQSNLSEDIEMDSEVLRERSGARQNESIVDVESETELEIGNETEPELELESDPVTEIQITASEAAETMNQTRYETMYVVNCETSISLRTEPNTSAPAIRQIPLGEAVSYVYTAENGFYQVIYMGDTGYALATYLSSERPAVTQPAQTQPTQNSSSQQTSYETMYVVNCNVSITLRTSPNTSASEIRQIPLGAAVSYIEPAANGFYKVVYLGDTGYALASYLSYDSPAASNEATPIYTSMQVVNCNESITLRTSPSTSASEIMQIPLGAYVSYIENAANGFYKVSYMGYTGYALASYLQ